jgi:HK97 family phage portal protein
MILDRLFPRRADAALAAGQNRVTSGIKTYSETPGVLWTRTGSSAGVHVDEYEALTISAVFAACFRLANVAAMLPVGVYDKDPGTGRRKELATHPASRILSVEANPIQTAFTARHFMQFWKPLFGAAVAEIGWDGRGGVRYLWPLEPWRVCWGYDEDGNDVFVVDGRRKVAPADMVYVPHVVEDGKEGRGFLHWAIESLGSAIAADRSAGRFYQNDMKPGGILQHPGSPSKESRGELREEWGRAHGGVANRGKVGVLWGGWQWVKDSGMIDPDKAQLLESRQWSVVEVARWLNVPPHWLADLGRATWANIESQSIEALIYCVQPILTATEQEYDRKLLAPPRVYCKHNTNALLRSDSKTRSEFYGKMKEIGVYTTNMILGYEDENGVGPEGDQRFVPVNWQPADDLMTGGEAQRQAAEASAKAKQPAVGQPGGTSPKPAANEKQGVRNDAEPVSNATDTGPKPELVEAFRKVAAAAYAGLARKEINAAQRVVRKSSKETMAWMDTFYEDFAQLMAESLAHVAELSIALKGDAGRFLAADRAAGWAKNWADESREQLLGAMECKAEEWPNRSAALLRAWETRAAGEAAGLARLHGGN